MRIIIHMCTNIEGMLRNMSESEAISEIAKLQSKGHQVSFVPLRKKRFTTTLTESLYDTKMRY